MMLFLGPCNRSQLCLTFIILLFSTALIAQNDSLSEKEVHSRVAQYSDSLAQYTRLAANDAEYAQKQASIAYEWFLGRGQDYFLLQDGEHALADYVSASRLKPQDYRAFQAIGELQALSENYDEAVRAYETCFRLNPTCTDGWVNLGYAQSRLGRADDALLTYTKALTLPHVKLRELILNNRGSLYLDRGEYQAAEADLRAAIAIAPATAMPRISLGELYLQQKRYPEALTTFNAALMQKPLSNLESWAGHYRRGLAYQALKNYPIAAQDFTAAIATNPSYTEAYEQLGNIYTQMGKFCDAVAILRQALSHTQRIDPAFHSDTALQLHTLEVQHPECSH